MKKIKLILTLLLMSTVVAKEATGCCCVAPATVHTGIAAGVATAGVLNVVRGAESGNGLLAAGGYTTVAGAAIIGVGSLTATLLRICGTETKIAGTIGTMIAAPGYVAAVIGGVLSYVSSAADTTILDQSSVTFISLGATMAGMAVGAVADCSLTLSANRSAQAAIEEARCRAAGYQ